MPDNINNNKYIIKDDEGSAASRDDSKMQGNKDRGWYENPSERPRG